MSADTGELADGLPAPIPTDQFDYELPPELIAQRPAEPRDASRLLVLDRNADRLEHATFRAPTVIPVLGALTCAYLVGPWTGRDTVEYRIGGALLALGVVLWVLTWFWNRGVRAKSTGFRDIDHLGK